MNPCELSAVDVHAHYGTLQLDHPDLASRMMSSDAATVARRARAARTQWTAVSPLSGLFPRGRADACAGNEEANRIVPQTSGLLQWVIVHPLQPRTYQQAAQMLRQPHCVGIKIHPEEHCYPIAEHGRAIFEFALEHRAVVLTHSGDPHSWPADFVPFANDYPQLKLILAHLGNGGTAGGDPSLQVRAIQACKHHNVWVDTSSKRSILPGLVEWAVTELGASRILYGTDAPLYFNPMQRARIDHAEISDDDKRLILRENALQLLGLSR